jgi:hypothetical protein
MPEDEAKILASIANVTDDLDKILDRLFENVEQLKVILRAQPQPDPEPGQEKP